MIHLLYGRLSVDAVAKMLLISSVAATMKEFSTRVTGENNPLAAMILADLQKVLIDDVGKPSMRDKLQFMQGGAEALDVRHSDMPLSTKLAAKCNAIAAKNQIAAPMARLLIEIDGALCCSYYKRPPQ